MTEIEYAINVQGINLSENIKDIDDLVCNERLSNTITVVVTPFEDLKESFDRLTQSRGKTICLSSVGMIDIVPLFEKVYENECSRLDFIFVGYGNFEIARRNMINYSSVLERIDHISSFMISRKFEQLRHSMTAVLEFYLFPQMFYHVYHNKDSVMKEYCEMAKDKITIRVVNLNEWRLYE